MITEVTNMTTSSNTTYSLPALNSHLSLTLTPRATTNLTLHFTKDTNSPLPTIYSHPLVTGHNLHHNVFLLQNITVPHHEP